MLTLGTESKHIQAALDTAGGFAWWYLDITNRRGDGLVLIWSFGLPFLPGRAAAARRGEATAARDRPSLNICIYEEGELDFYLLQEYPPEDVSQPENKRGEWRFGQTSITSRLDGESGDSHIVEVDLNCRVPGSDDRLTGSIEIRGSAVSSDDALTFDKGEAGHHWQILTTATEGRVELDCAEKGYAFSGRAYHDTNNGTRPLHELGINYWMWGRVPDGPSEKVFYALWPEGRDESPACFGLQIDRDGSVELQRRLQLALEEPDRTLGGMNWWRRVELRNNEKSWLTLEYTEPVDSGPFYLRCLPTSEKARGVGEFIAPDRIDLVRYRPLVNMRVDHLDGRNSMWLPLFSGPRSGRVRRLLTQWW